VSIAPQEPSPQRATSLALGRVWDIASMNAIQPCHAAIGLMVVPSLRRRSVDDDCSLGTPVRPDGRPASALMHLDLLIE
jgi:hypothetical protein